MNWRFWRRKEPQADQALADWLRWEADKRASGWVPWTYRRPSSEHVEVSRREWPTIGVWKVSTIPPWVNAADLWWRECRGEVVVGSIYEIESGG